MSAQITKPISLAGLLLLAALVALAAAGYTDEIVFPTTTPAPYIRSLLNSTSQPTWFTYCTEPPNPDERLITVILGPQTFQPSRTVDQLHKEASKFVASYNFDKRPKAPAVTRRKRSVSATFGDHTKAAILFKKPRYKQVATKKTSFAAWSPRSPTAKYRPRHGRYFTAPEVAPLMLANAPSAAAAAAAAAAANDSEKRLVETLVGANIRLAWSFNCGLNTCRLPKHAANELREELAKSLDRQKITQGDMDGAERRRAKWWPAVDSLIVRKDSRGEALVVGRELERSLTNISHYLQFFSVAFEQMEFEEKSGPRWRQFNYLSRHNLKIMCELESMVAQLDSFRSNSANVSGSAMTKLKQRLPDPNPLLKLMDDENVGDGFRSPLSLEQRKTGSAATDVKLERSVMPLGERELASQLERDLRNWLILKDYEKTISYYELMLASLFI